MQAVLEYLEKYDTFTGDLFTILEKAIQCLPENVPLAARLDSVVLEKIDVIFLSSCKAESRRCIKMLAQGCWNLKPHQFVEHWGYGMRDKLLFLKKLIKLSALIPLTESVAAIRAQYSDISTGRGTNGNPKPLTARHVENVIRTLVPKSTRKYVCRRAKPNETLTPDARVRTPESIASEPRGAHDAVRTPPQNHQDRYGATPGDAITVSDEDPGSTASHFSTVYEDTLRRKCIECLQNPTSWLIEDVFDAVLPVFTSHDERILVVNSGLINVDNPRSNHGKEIRALKESHGLLLIPLNIGKSHWMLALLDVSKNEALIYDPLHSENNITKAETALQNFGRDKEKVGRFSDWTFVKHPEPNDTVNCGIYCCVVAISSVLNVEVPKTIYPNLWRQGFLELIGGKSDDLHSDLDCLYNPRSWSSDEDFEQQKRFIASMIDHKDIIITANNEAVKNVKRNLESMRNEFVKFYLTLSFSNSEIERLCKITENRSRGLDNMLTKMSYYIGVLQAGWHEAGSAAWFG